MSCSPTDTDTSKLKVWKVPLRRGDDYDIDIDDESPDLRGSAERYSRSKRFGVFFSQITTMNSAQSFQYPGIPDTNGHAKGSRAGIEHRGSEDVSDHAARTCIPLTPQ